MEDIGYCFKMFARKPVKTILKSLSTGRRFPLNGLYKNSVQRIPDQRTLLEKHPYSQNLEPTI
jgi:hypothetical protein